MGAPPGVRALGAAVLLLLVADPWLARSPGFALSVLATGGILFVAPPFRDALAQWLPRPVAEAVAVPLAAQLACTPVVAALSDQVSLVAVAANLLVAPAVGPATVLGLGGGLLGLVVPAGRRRGSGGWRRGARSWIVVVAGRAAALPGAAVDWSGDALGVPALTVLCLVLDGCRAAGAAEPDGGRRWWRSPSASWWRCRCRRPGWPPRGWLLVDVRRRAGRRARARRRLRRGGRRRRRARPAGGRPLPAAGSAVTRGPGGRAHPLPRRPRRRAAGRAPWPARSARSQVSGLAEPADGAARVAPVGGGGRRPGPRAGVRRDRPGRHRDLAGARPAGDPRRQPERRLAGAAGARSAGVRLLLTGDVEPAAQAAAGPRAARATWTCSRCLTTAAATRTRRGSASLRPRVALVSVGEDNDYGHPAPRLLRPAAPRQGALVRRTDQDGDVAVVVPRRSGSGWSTAVADRSRAARGPRRCRRAVAGCRPWRASSPGARSGTVVLVTGPEELLNERVVEAATAAVRRADPEAEVSATTGDQLTMASLGELAAPSLFSSIRCVVVRRLEDVPDESHDGLRRLRRRPRPGHRAGAGALRRRRRAAGC